ncbi:MAG: hypothetical protein QNM02_07430, partial [Acidimicrobiia bacterium]|nr:hypothetical protein [Acidimicrobiia bacterium]
MSDRGATCWTPAPDAWARSRLAEFATHITRTTGLKFDDYDTLLDWSLADPGAFWMAVSEWTDVLWHTA